MQNEKISLRSQYFIYGFAMVAIALVIYGFGLASPFQFDDISNITKNFSIRDLNVSSQFMIHTRWFGEMINRLTFRIGNFEPFYYRVFNLLIHLSSGLACFALAHLICTRQRVSQFVKDSASFVSHAVFGLFLLHPVQSQTVSYVIQAGLEGVAAFLVLLSIYSFFRSFDQVEAASQRFWFILSQVLVFLACSTKETAVVAPFLALLIDLFWISDFSWKELKPRLVRYLIYFSLTLLIVTFFLKPSFVSEALSFGATTFNNRGNIVTSVPMQKISAYSYLISQFRIILHYLTIFFIPTNLCVVYNYPLIQSFLSWQPVVSLLVLLGLGLGSVASIKREKWRPLGFGYFWFMVALAPRASIVPCAELTCDYKTYLSSFGMFWAMAFLMIRLFDIVSPGVRKEAVLEREKKRDVFLGFILAACAILTFQRNKIWSDPIMFWVDMVEKNPGKARPLNNLGVSLTEAERYDEAVECYQKAIELDKYYPDPLSNLAVVYSTKEDYSKAIMCLHRALEIVPNYPEAYNNLAALYVKTKEVDRAIPLLEKAISLRSFYGKAHFNLGRCYYEKKEYGKAWESFKNATLGDLDNLEGFMALGQISLVAQNYQEAVDSFNKVVKIGGGTVDNWFNLANAYNLNGEMSQAEDIYKMLLSKSLSDYRVQYNLAETLFAQKKYSQAYEYFDAFSKDYTKAPQALFRAACCLEHIYGLDKAGEYLEKYKDLEFPENVKEVLKKELGRIRLQSRINAGNGTVNSEDLKEMFGG